MDAIKWQWVGRVLHGLGIVVLAFYLFLTFFPPLDLGPLDPSAEGIAERKQQYRAHGNKLIVILVGSAVLTIAGSVARYKLGKPALLSDLRE